MCHTDNGTSLVSRGRRPIFSPLLPVNLMHETQPSQSTGFLIRQEREKFASLA